jgi:ubiquinone/menaquinone biosynthesis C-methylase UbiE
VCALDINPVAVENLRRKVRENRLNIVRVALADVRKTGLLANSFHVAFLFGVIHDFPDVGILIQEMHRVLKPKGLLPIQKSTIGSKTLRRYN